MKDRPRIIGTKMAYVDGQLVEVKIVEARSAGGPLTWRPYLEYRQAPGPRNMNSVEAGSPGMPGVAPPKAKEGVKKTKAKYKAIKRRKHV